MPLTVQGIDELYSKQLISQQERDLLRQKVRDDARKLEETKTRFVSALSKEVSDNWAHLVVSLKEVGAEFVATGAEAKQIAAKVTGTAVAGEKKPGDQIPKTKYSGFFLAPLAEAAWHALGLLASPITVQGKLANEDTQAYLVKHGASPMVASIAGTVADFAIQGIFSAGVGAGVKAIKAAEWAGSFKKEAAVKQVLENIVTDSTASKARALVEEQAKATEKEAEAFISKKTAGKGLEDIFDIEEKQKAAKGETLIDALKGLVDPETGNFTRGGDYIHSLMEKHSSEEIISFMRWARQGKSSPYVARFGPDYGADILRQRGVPVDKSAWQWEHIIEQKTQQLNNAHDNLAQAQDAIIPPKSETTAALDQAAASVTPPAAEKLTEAQVDASSLIPKPKVWTVTPGDTAEMIDRARSESDIHTILSMVTDQTNPRDVRQAFANRLNEIKPRQINEFLHSVENRDFLQTIGRSGMLPNSITMIAKGRAAEMPTTPLEKLKQFGAPRGGAPGPDEYVKQFNNVVTEYKAQLERYQAHGLSREMAEEQASKLLSEGYGLNDIMAIMPQEAKNPAQTLAVIKTVLPYAEESMNLREAARTDDQAFMKILGNMTTLFGANPRYFGIRSTAGQTLGIYRDPTFGQTKFLEQFHKMASWLAGMDLKSPEDIMRNKDRILNVLDNFKNPAQLIKHQLGMPEEATSKMNWWDAWTGYFAQNLLGPLVVSKKMFGDAAATLYRPLIEKPMERLLYKGLSRFSDNPLGLTISDIPVPGESVASLYGYRRGWMRAWDYLRNKDFMGLAEATGQGSLDIRPSLSDFLEERFGKAGAIFGDTVGFIPASIKHLTNAARLAAFETEASGLLWREGVQMGKKGAELENWVEDGLRSVPPNMMDKALKQADKATFTDAPGAFAQWVSQGLNEFKVMKFDVPFWRVPVNLLRWGYQRSPVLSLTSVQNIRDLKAGGIEAIDAAAKMMVGNIVGGGLIMGGYAGWITGSGPNNAKLRSEMIQAGAFKPYSIYNPISGNWIDYSLLHPFKAVVGTAADIGFLWNQLPWNEGAIQDTYNAFSAFAAATARNFGENPFFTGITSTAKTVEEAMAGTITGTKAMKRSAGQFISGFIPLSSTWRYIGQELDPGLKEVHGVMDVVQSQLPLLNQSLYAKRDYRGRPEQLPDSIGPRSLSLIRTRDGKEDPIDAEHMRLQLSFGDQGDHILGPQEPDDPTRIVTKTGVPLNPEEQDFRDQRLGELYSKSAEDIIGNADYKSMPDAIKIRALRNARGAARNQATGEAIDKYPALRQRVDTEMQKRDSSISVDSNLGQSVLDYQALRQGSQQQETPP